MHMEDSLALTPLGGREEVQLMEVDMVSMATMLLTADTTHMVPTEVQAIRTTIHPTLTTWPPKTTLVSFLDENKSL